MVRFFMSSALFFVTPSWADDPTPEPTTTENNTFDESEFMKITIQKARPKRRAKPVFPQAAKVNGISGYCSVQLYIDEKGKPLHAVTKCSDILFEKSATDAGMKWRFHPYEIDGKAEKVQFQLKLKFDLK